jgi:hypothetical protein
MQLRKYHFNKKIDLDLPPQKLEIYFGLDGISENKVKLSNAYFEATKKVSDIDQKIKIENKNKRTIGEIENKKKLKRKKKKKWKTSLTVDVGFI